MAEKFDIFPLIRRLNSGDLAAFDKLSETDKGQASPFMAMKFMSGCSDPAQILKINQLVNTRIFSSTNKSLLFKLLAISASRRVTNVKWPGQMKDTKSLELEVIAKFYDCSIREAKTMIPNFNLSQLCEMAEQLGMDDESIKKLRKK